MFYLQIQQKNTIFAANCFINVLLKYGNVQDGNNKVQCEKRCNTPNKYSGNAQQKIKVYKYKFGCD